MKLNERIELPRIHIDETLSINGLKRYFKKNNMIFIATRPFNCLSGGDFQKVQSFESGYAVITPYTVKEIHEYLKDHSLINIRHAGTTTVGEIALFFDIIGYNILEWKDFALICKCIPVYLNSLSHRHFQTKKSEIEKMSNQLFNAYRNEIEEKDIEDSLQYQNDNLKTLLRKVYTHNQNKVSMRDPVELKGSDRADIYRKLCDYLDHECDDTNQFDIVIISHNTKNEKQLL